MTISGNLVQLTDASEFANTNNDDGREDGGRWPSWLLFDKAMGWAYKCLHLCDGDGDRINGTTAFNFKCMSMNQYQLQDITQSRFMHDTLLQLSK